MGPAFEPERAGHQPSTAENHATNLAERLRFLGLDESDAQQARKILARIESGENALVEAFYRHLFAFQQTSRFLQDEKLVARLKESQRLHLRSMLAADWSERYAEDRHRVGDTHAEVGIEPQYFLGAYCQYLQFCFSELAESHQGTPQELSESLLVLIKVVMLDIGLTLDAYFAHSTSTLRSALDMLWKANTELRQFAHLTSHDLKTPLATVANLCDEAIDEFGSQIPKPACDLIEAARQRTYRMSTMIDELLSAVTLPEDADDTEEIDTQAVVEEVIDRLRAEIDRKQIHLTIQEPLPKVWGNRVRIREAFYNLVSNAVKFIERQPGQIAISAVSKKDHFVFMFADNGPGIPKDELERIFSPFRRLAGKSKPGSGLGLYFAKNLIEQQGGRVWAESQLGVCSRFCVMLPRPVTLS